MPVVRMRQRPDQRKQMAALCQQGQMFAYEYSRRVGGDGFELAPDRIRGIWLQVEAFVLRETAGEKDIDDAFGFCSTDLRGFLGRHRPKRLQFPDPQP